MLGEPEHPVSELSGHWRCLGARGHGGLGLNTLPRGGGSVHIALPHSPRQATGVRFRFPVATAK